MNLKFIKRFVEESDAIERVYHDTPSRYYQDHINAAIRVINEAQDGRLVHPTEIHAMLAREAFGPEAGVYRKVGVMVGRHTPINPVAVPTAMEYWWDYANAVVAQYKDMPEDVRMVYSWKIHHYLEQIHPFIDFNGRTGRLIWLSCRIILGLRPQIIYENEKEGYYNSIESFINCK